MKREIVFGIVLLLLLLLCAGCANILSQAASQQETPPENSHVEMQQEFPPDYSRAESIKITIYGGTATGQSFVVKRADDSMMWNRDELPISHDSVGTPYLPAINFTFMTPDEYLFDVLMDVMFNDWEYSPGKHSHTDEEGHYNIVIYDDENSEIMAFDLFYQACVLFNGAFYSISPDSDHVTGPEIDGYPFMTAYFINRGLYYHGGTTSNGLMENASPGTSVLSLYVYDGVKTRLSTLSAPHSVDILKELDTVKVSRIDNWSLGEITLPIYGLSIGGNNGFSIFAAWSNGFWITQDGEVYSFEYDFEKLENDYSWSGRRDFSGITVMPCAYFLAKDENGWNDALLTPSGEFVSPTDVTMTLVSCSSNAVNVSIANNSSEDWNYGENFVIQVSVNGVWYSVPTATGNWGFTSIGLVVQAGKQQNKTYHLTMYGELPAGTYRLVTYGLSVEFLVS